MNKHHYNCSVESIYKHICIYHCRVSIFMLQYSESCIQFLILINIYFPYKYEIWTVHICCRKFGKCDNRQKMLTICQSGITLPPPPLFFLKQSWDHTIQLDFLKFLLCIFLNINCYRQNNRVNYHMPSSHHSYCSVASFYII